MRFFGDKKNTICRIAIAQSDVNPGRRKIRYDLCPDRGDGTVPRWTAAEAGRVDPKFTRALSEEHVALAKAKEFVDYVRGSFNEFHRSFQRRVMAAAGDNEEVQKRHKQALINVYTRLEVLVPRAAPATAADELTGEINRAVARNLEVSADEIYDGARSKPRAERADGFRVYQDLIEDPELATSPVVSEIRFSWAMNKVAHNFLERRDFVRALDFAQRALDSVEAVSDARGRRIRGLAAMTAAVAAKELKDDAGRRKYCDLALTNGNPNAKLATCR